MPNHDLELTIDAPDSVWTVINELGRTEDVAFSPDNRRLAVACYGRKRITIFDLDISASDSTRKVILEDYVEISSSSLRAPHGLIFLDDETLIVANRWGEAPVFKVPTSGGTNKKLDLNPLQTLREDDRHQLSSPGSISAAQINDRLFEVFVCNNYVNYVSRHELDREESFAVKSSEIYLQRGLEIPDGVTTSNDKRWIAISNHSCHSVFIYEKTEELDPNSKPVGILRNLNYPHGLRFVADDSFIVVADAGAPYVNIYKTNDRNWKGTRGPVATVRVMDESTYKLGRHNPQEGGPKGVDVDTSETVLVTTCDEQNLAFFYLPGILQTRSIPFDRHKKAIQWHYERLRDELRRLRGWK